MQTNISTEGSTSSVLSRGLRTNPHYELIVKNGMADNSVDLSASGHIDTNNVLRPFSTSYGPSLVICNDTVTVWRSVQTTGNLPDFAFAAELNGNRSITRLILDGILEIQDDAGNFLSGPLALPLLFQKQLARNEMQRVAKISYDAVRFAGQLVNEDVMSLTGKLYQYNSLPRTRMHISRFPDQASVRRFLGLYTGSRLTSQLNNSWVETNNPNQTPWFSWTKKRVGKLPRIKVIVKLYISPLLEDVPTVLSALTMLTDDVPIIQFKVGANLSGLLRPDKIVAYFGSIEGILKAVEQLQFLDDHCIAQGVPFSASLSDSGLFSWGFDPVEKETDTSHEHRMSWRYWVSSQLALYLHTAHQKQVDTVDPAEFALRRLELEGVDVMSWIPQSDIWDEPQTFGA